MGEWIEKQQLVFLLITITKFKKGVGSAMPREKKDTSYRLSKKKPIVLLKAWV